MILFFVLSSTKRKTDELYTNMIYYYFECHVRRILIESIHTLVHAYSASYS